MSFNSSLKDKSKASSMNLATKMYRRMEMHERVELLESKCQVALRNIERLQNQAKLFVEDITNQNEADFKDVYLHHMKELDEYVYVVTEFNLFVETLGLPLLEDSNSHTESPEKLDLDEIIKLSKHPDSLLDALSEPFNSLKIKTSPKTTKPVSIKQPKDGFLISFSSCSASAESIPFNNYSFPVRNDKKSTELLNNVLQEFDQLKLSHVTEISELTLPAQTVLNIDSEYTGFIIHIELPAIWIIIGDLKDLHELKNKMNNFYNNGDTIVNLDDKHLNYWAMYDVETDHWYRVLLLNHIGDDLAQVFLVDTGEEKNVNQEFLKYLAPQFYHYPPFARCCHLAEFDLEDESREVVDAITEMMKKYLGCTCTVKIEDNNSESFAVTIKTEEGHILNDEIMISGITKPIPDNTNVENVQPLTSHGPITEEIDISDCPEHEDALTAVTGYHNRDEAEICKFYRAGQNTCWKKQCNKKHIPIHPEGWTMDQVPCIAKLPPLPLPKPGVWKNVRVTSVVHVNRVYLQFLNDEEPELIKRQFGVLLPPRTLEELVTEMNSPFVKYEPCTIEPAIGELVVVKYQDQCWYRARVMNVARSHQYVEVMYVDYGTIIWVAEWEIYKFPTHLASVPAQAVCAKLAGLKQLPQTPPERLQDAQNKLKRLVLDKTFEARIISRSYDEIEVVLSSGGYSVGDELTVLCPCLEIEPFRIEYDEGITCKVVVP